MRLLLFLFVVIAVGCGQPEPPLPKLGIPDYDENGAEIPPKVDDIVLTDHLGNTFNSEKVGERIWVVNTFFTSCPTICPTMTKNVVPVFDQYKDAPVVFSSFTVNPERDDPARLSAFMASHDIPSDQNWFFLTGEKEKIYTFALKELFLSAMDSGTEVTPDFIHSEKVILIDKNRYIRGFYTGTDEDSMIALSNDIKRLLEEE